MNRLFLATLCAAAVMTATSATATPAATLMTVEYFGFVGSAGVDHRGQFGADEIGLFGPEGGSLVGSSYHARYTFDTTAGNYSISNGILSFNGRSTSGNSPVRSASVTIGGVSLDIPILPSTTISTNSERKFTESVFEYGDFLGQTAGGLNNAGTAQAHRAGTFMESRPLGYGYSEIKVWEISNGVYDPSQMMPGYLTPFETLPYTLRGFKANEFYFSLSEYFFRDDPPTNYQTITRGQVVIDRLAIDFSVPPPPPPPPPPGETPENPIMPVDTGPDGEFIFEFEAVPDEPAYWDPVVSVGYDYLISAGGGASELWFVDVGDIDGYELYLWNDGALDYEFFGFVSAGTWIDIGGSTSRFRLLGIDAALGLDPTDPMAFVTGAKGLAGSVALTMTPITLDTGGGPGIVPEPASWAMLIAGFGLVGVVARRRRRAFA